MARLYSALGQVGHGIGYRMQTDIPIDAVYERIAAVLPATNARPSGAEETRRFFDAAVAEGSKLVAAGSLAERALALGLAYADVIVLARTADLLGLLIVLYRTSESEYRPKLEDATARLVSAQETCAGALERFVAGLEHEDVAPDVLEAASLLRQNVTSRAPRFDGADAAHTWRPGETWWKGLENAIIELAIALAVPASDAPKAEAIRKLGASTVTVKNGMVEELVVSTERYILEWRAIRATAPVRRVRLTGVRPLLDALLASGALRDTLWIDLLGEGLDDADIAKIAAAPDLATVRALGLDRNRISDRGVRTIWASPILAQLLYCGLNGNPCSELATQELTPEEYSRYEWVSTEHARALQAELGSRRWPVPSEIHWPPTLDDLVRWTS